MRRWLTPLLVAVAVTAGVTPVAAAPRASEVRFLEFNMCGAICNKGTVDRPGPANDVVEHVADLLTERRPHLVVLNEICGAQLRRLRRLLEEAGRPMASAFHAQRRDGRCRAGVDDADDRFGDAVLSPGASGEATAHVLPNRPSGGEQRALLCLPTTVGIDLLACGLHLVALEPEWHPRQLDEVVRFVRRPHEGRTVVVIGDFNATPDELGRLSDPAQGGAFRDVDHADDEPTFYRAKIDYVFLPRARFHGMSATVTTSSWSDHRILEGRALLKP